MWKKIAGVLLTIGFAGLTWAQQIDLNKATEVELDALKGVGPVLTKAVMDERKKAPFKDCGCKAVLTPSKWLIKSLPPAKT